ncbi:MAG: BatD family protein, partial [Synergistaceae bacterium]|nr:BatD family protein [Synergistaceae bacterium]
MCKKLAFSGRESFGSLAGSAARPVRSISALLCIIICLVLRAGPALAADYAIQLDRTGTYTFPAAVIGYGGQTPLSVRVTNTGTQNT